MEFGSSFPIIPPTVEQTLQLLESGNVRAAIIESERDVPVAGDWLAEDMHYIDLCLSGRPTSSQGCFVDWSRRLINLGEIFYVPAGFRMYARGSVGRQRVLRLFLPTDETDGSRDMPPNDYLHVRSLTVRQNLLRIAQEVISPGFAADMLVEGLALVVLADLKRIEAARDSGKRRIGGLAQWRLRVIEQQVMEGGAPPSIADLATACRLSSRHLMRAFREETGQSLGVYIADFAMRRAQNQLREGKLPIAHIAAEAGFRSSSSFGAAFRRATSMTPQAYRMAVTTKGGLA
jgi:AraC family transcriptional regulator